MHASATIRPDLMTCQMLLKLLERCQTLIFSAWSS